MDLNDTLSNQQINNFTRQIKSIKGKMNNKLYKLFYDKDYFYEKLCDLYELLIMCCLVNKKYDIYYQYILEYNEILEDRYKSIMDMTAKRIQISNIKALLDINIYDKIQSAPENTYSNLIDIYMKYNNDTGNCNAHISSIEKIIKLYMSNKEKYNCNIIKYLDTYHELTGLYHKKHGDILLDDTRYNDAIPIYQSYIDTYISDCNLKYSVGAYVYNMMICYMLVGDDIPIAKKYAELTQNYPSLNYNYDFKFILKIVDAYLKKDIDLYTNIIAEQDSIKSLSDDNVRQLLIIKQNMQQTSDLC